MTLIQNKNLVFEIKRQSLLIILFALFFNLSKNQLLGQSKEETIHYINKKLQDFFPSESFEINKYGNITLINGDHQSKHQFELTSCTFDTVRYLGYNHLAKGNIYYYGVNLKCKNNSNCITVRLEGYLGKSNTITLHTTDENEALKLKKALEHLLEMYPNFEKDPFDR